MKTVLPVKAKARPEYAMCAYCDRSARDGRNHKRGVCLRPRGWRKSDTHFGDVWIRHGKRGWYVLGYRMILGYHKTLPKCKKAVELAAIGAIMEQLCDDGLLVRVP